MRTFTFACIASILSFILDVIAFDISAYKDPRSEARLGSHWGSNFGDCNSNGWADSADYAAWVERTQAANHEAMRLYAEMGMTNLMVYYKDEDFAQLEDTPFQVMNWLAPGHAFKYLQAQHRGVELGVEDSIYNFGTLNWGNETIRLDVENVLVQNDEQTILRITPSAGAGAFWRPVLADAVNLGPWSWETFGSWNGWTARGCPDGFEPRGHFMPFHFELVSKVQIDSSDLDDTHVATLWWYVATEEWNDTVEINNTIYTRGFWRYPGIRIHYTDYDQDNVVFDRLQLYLGADSLIDLYRDSTGRYEDSLVRGCDYNLNPIPGDASQEVSHASNVSWGGKNRVYFAIDYTGHHTLMAYSFEAWDEGYHRLFRADPDTIEFYKEKLVTAFQHQYDLAGGKLAGWYSDEFSNDMMDAWLRVNKYLQDAGLPRIFLNGWESTIDGNGQRDSILLRAAQDDVDLNVFMMEFYPYKNDSTCQPADPNNYLFSDTYVDPSSDVDYWQYEFAGAQCNWGGWRRGEPVYFSPNSTKISLQASLDNKIWGPRPIFEMYDVTVHRHPLTSYISSGLAGECALSHSRGVKQWALLQSSGAGGSVLSGEMRVPSPQEIGLECWLSVACDADGVMWYSGLSSPRADSASASWSGLIEWGTPEGDTLYDVNFCDGTPTVFGTPNYVAAKEVCNDIHEIAPTLEALEFVKTYASRAFEESYGANATHVSTYFDTLGQGHQEPGDDGQFGLYPLDWTVRVLIS